MSEDPTNGVSDQQNLFDPNAALASAGHSTLDLKTLEAQLRLLLPELQSTLHELESAREVPQSILQLDFSV